MWRTRWMIVSVGLPSVASPSNTNALLLDMGFNKWKAKASYAYYDAPLVRRIRDNLRQLRRANDAESVKTVLEVRIVAFLCSLLCSALTLGTLDLPPLQLRRHRTRQTVLGDLLRHKDFGGRLSQRG